MFGIFLTPLLVTLLLNVHGDSGSIGQLVFHANGETLPEDAIQGVEPSLHYHLYDFHHALDVLRY